MTITISAGLFYSTESFAQSPTAIDMSTPHITAPANLIITATTVNGTLLTAAQLGTPTVSDDTDPAPTINNNAPAIFPIGITTIIWTATDASGNTASAAQRVIIEDRVSPTIIAPSDYTLDADSTIIILDPNQVGTALASDNIDTIPAITSDIDKRRGIGDSKVLWTATDAAGNTATAIQRIFIQNTNSSLIKPNVTIMYDTFDNNTSPWRNWGAPLQPTSASDCTRSNTNRHSVTHSSFNNGSVYFDLNGACGTGFIGMQRGFTYGSQVNGYDLEFSFDYVYVAKDGADPLRVHLITDGSPQTPHPSHAWTFTVEPTNGTQLNTFTTRTSMADFTKCPCRILVLGLANSLYNATYHIDNVKISAIPVTSGIAIADDAVSGAVSSNIVTESNGFSTIEILDMLLLDNNAQNRVLFLSKQSSENTISISWDTIHQGPYKIVIAPVSDPHSKTAKIIDANISNYTFSNLESNTAYFVSVGVRGNDDETQSTIIVSTDETNGNNVSFNSQLDLNVSHTVGSDTIHIEWTDQNGIGENTYRVQRLVPGGMYVDEQFGPKNGTITSDRIRPDWMGQDISYRVFERVGQHKIFSDIVTVTIPDSLEPVKNFGVKSIEYSFSSGQNTTLIQLGWDHAPLFRNYLVETQSIDDSWIKLEKTNQNSVIHEMQSVNQNVTIAFRITTQMGPATSEPVEIRHTVYGSLP